MSENMVSVRVWGDFACFTRPEMKVERVSYPVMTPSAARGILEAIFWEPQMYYLVDSIQVVRKGRWISVRRNEVEKTVNLGSPRIISAGGGAPDGTQRNMLALEDVEYVISAEVRISELGCKTSQPLSKYTSELKRRASQGKCYHRPALGVREFAADFEWVEDTTAVPRADWAEEDLGLMLYDVFDAGQRGKGFRWFTDDEHEAQMTTGAKPTGRKDAPPRYEGLIVKPQATFFQATIRNARLDCHPERVRLIASSTKEG